MLVEHPANGIVAVTIGGAIEVHRTLGPGLLESAYQRCLCRELELRGLKVSTQVPVNLEYRGVRLERAYSIDLVVEELVVVEIKSVEQLQSIHTSQLLTYLRLTGIPCGLLINFNVDQLIKGIRRILT
ncbi:MAG: GxxExxY protein [Gemmatimonadales bacterium]